MNLDFRYKWEELSEEQQSKLIDTEMYKPIFLNYDSHKVCVVKLEDGFHAVSNTCPHAGAALHTGWCNKKGVIVCPLHQYKFDIKTGQSIDGNGYVLKRYKIKEEEGKLSLGIKRF